MAYHAPRLFDPVQDRELVPQLAQIHHDCVLQDHTMASFLPPLHMLDMVSYWHNWVADVERNLRDIIIQTETYEDGDKAEVVGVVSLWRPISGTGPFRAEVHKLLVSPKHRHKGIARTLMSKLEEVARQKDRWLLLLDTTVGTTAEHVYPKLGFKRFGVVPNYGFSPEDGKLRDEVFFFKHLCEPRTIAKQPASSPKPPEAVSGARYAAFE